MNLKQFAELVGVSQTTVSRALNGHPEVSARTRARVVEAARRHGYAPNAHARFLAKGRAAALGCVLPMSGRNEIVNPIYTDFLAGLGEECAHRKFEINLCAVQDHEQETAYRQLKSKGLVGGVVVQFPRHDDPRPALLDKIGLPFVVHGRVSRHDAPYSWVDVNNQRAFHRATAFLLQLGHRRIALLNGDDSLDFATRRRDGWLQALAEAGVSPQPELALSDEMTTAYGYRTTLRLLARPEPPTALLCSSTVIAHGVKQALEEAGLRLGADMSVLCFDDDLSYLRNPGAVPIFTAMRSPVREAGRRIAAMLIDKIETGDPTPRQELMEADLVVGRSTAPPWAG
ncbi:substrate-binding domain-containing protein [Paracoccus sp. R12_1]|uniref:LacI family DNA-binding transcriptional regulator n=1 Tax=unclassified Paracoccus (in: a-proteobacteria) TaxID=2688777 RepID=UPI001ADAC43C|nr:MULTISPECIES: substrate-binding domain-containing protein [unclassified Paracoccus (in: a-proteobacteria)]MBO9453812.1 substrate-binding domain-containing protein [Paracoccus sp. R12_2]MBO9486764.1 substrate-binding domain-containing protein [Paracoccus sp. R12_1]